MEKIRLGRTEMMVSRVGFGGIPIQRDTPEEAIEVVRRCLEHGINFIDTANAYTTSEERVGRAISGQRDGLIVATKSGSRTRDGLENHLNLSLKQLSVESIDLFQFHNVSDLKTLDIILDPKGPRATIEAAKKKGIIKHIGVTSHSMDAAKEAVKSDCFETIMFPFNFITNEAADELLPLAREHDVGFIAMKPFAGGALSNAAIALKYLLQFPDVVPIPGIEKPWEIDEIAEILEGSWQMTAEEEHEMNRLKDELGTRFCRRCDYCQPCQEDISISMVMISDSFFKRFPPERFFTGGIADVMEKAADCSECGDCEERCPYDLPIREIMVERVDWYKKEKSIYDKSL